MRKVRTVIHFHSRTKPMLMMLQSNSLHFNLSLDYYDSTLESKGTYFSSYRQEENSIQTSLISPADPLLKFLTFFAQWTVEVIERQQVERDRIWWCASKPPTQNAIILLLLVMSVMHIMKWIVKLTTFFLSFLSYLLPTNLPAYLTLDSSILHLMQWKERLCSSPPKPTHHMMHIISGQRDEWERMWQFTRCGHHIQRGDLWEENAFRSLPFH